MRTQLYFFSFFFFTSQWRKNPRVLKERLLQPNARQRAQSKQPRGNGGNSQVMAFFLCQRKSIINPTEEHTHTHTHKTNQTNPEHTDTASSKHDELLQLQIQVANSSSSETKCCWTTHILLSHSHANASWPPHKLFEIPSEGAPFLSID